MGWGVGAVAITGGSFTLSTGVGTATSSGSILLETENSGSSGVSGALSLTTGTSTAGSTGVKYP